MRARRVLVCLGFVTAVGCGSGAVAGDDDDGSEGPDAGTVNPPVAAACTEPTGGAVYEVGPGQEYAAIGDVPWHALGPGDTVRVHARSEPYREKILISRQGTEEQPIRLCGVTDDSGRRPVIDGDGATTSANMHFTSYLPLQDTGLIIIARSDDDEYGTRPQWIVIDGIEARGAKAGNSYTTSDGETRGYSDFTAAINVNAGASVVVRNCALIDNGLGLFVLSKSEEEGTLSRDILVEYNDISGNGVAQDYSEHNAYIQALGVTVQYNHFGRLRAGAWGANLKDRSAGLVVRYNWMEGGARILDLVDAQDNAPDAVADPRYRTTFVYGNVLVAGRNDGINLIHYGGDSGGEYVKNYRKGTLYYYFNTLLIEGWRDDLDHWRTSVFDLSTNEESVDARNNVVALTGDTFLTIMRDTGKASLGFNWVTAATKPNDESFDGTVLGADQLVTGSDPGLDPQTLRPMAGSPLRDRAGPLADAAAGLPDDLEYSPGELGAPRALRGDAPDLGAFEGE